MPRYVYFCPTAIFPGSFGHYADSDWEHFTSDFALTISYWDQVRQHTDDAFLRHATFMENLNLLYFWRQRAKLKEFPFESCLVERLRPLYEKPDAFKGDDVPDDTWTWLPSCMGPAGCEGRCVNFCTEHAAVHALTTFAERPFPACVQGYRDFVCFNIVQGGPGFDKVATRDPDARAVYSNALGANTVDLL